MIRAKKNIWLVCFLFCLVFIFGVEFWPGAASAQEGAFDWRSDWALQEGFVLDIDTEGYTFPTSIAFVPNPGSNPKDPFYFVTEIDGRVEVVTNDRSIYVFADNILDRQPEVELPAGKGQTGLAGLCLAPKQGYVFVTYAYLDNHKTLRNNVIRFETKPETFGLEPTAKKEFTEVFAPYESGLAHQIGPCQVQGDEVYISVGEAWQAYLTQKLDTMHGKIIRMSLDGEPIPDNPYYLDNDIRKAQNYIWAYGLRNPFGLKFVGDRLFVADNGQSVDRFLEIKKGENYLWNGDDRTIASNADFVWTTAVGPVQMDRYPENAALFPEEYREAFFVGLSAYDERKAKTTGIYEVDYSLDQNRVTRAPRYFVEYRGKGYQAVTGVAFGPDGLYFATLVPNQEGRTFILKASYKPDMEWPHVALQSGDAKQLFVQKGCAGCHSIGTSYGFGGSAGPDLERQALVERLDTYLNSEGYPQVVAAAEAMTTEPQVLYKSARQEVLAAKGTDRVHTWVKYRIMEPRFDNNFSMMPKLDVSEREAEILANFLVAEQEEDQASLLASLLPRPLRTRHLAIAFVGGTFSGIALWGVWQLLARTILKRAKARLIRARQGV